MRRLWVVVAALVAVLAGCGSSDSSSSSASDSGSAAAATANPALDALVAAAKKEGSVVWYSSQEEDTLAAVKTAFEQKYGIKLDYSRASSGPLQQRFTSEADAGKYLADVLNLANEPFFISSKDKGYFAPLTAAEVPAIAGYPADSWKSYYGVISIAPIALTYNTSLVKQDELPSAWSDLLKPSWKGRLALTDPRPVPVWGAWYEFFAKTYGFDALTNLVAQQQAKIINSSVSGTQQLGAGAFPTLFPNIPANTAPLKDKGAPVDAYAVSPTIGVEQIGSVVAKGPHPNAGRLLMNYLLSSDGQAAFTGTQHAASLLPNVAGTIPLPRGYQHPDWASYDADKTRILTALGITAQ